MASKRKKYAPEYKAEAVELVVSSGRPVAEIARDLGLNEGTLGSWVNAAKRSGSIKDKPLTVDERARMKELEEENRKLRMERDFLKKRPWNPVVVATRGRLIRPRSVYAGARPGYPSRAFCVVGR